LIPTEVLQSERADLSLLLAELRAAGMDTSKPKSIRCTYHDDKNPSAGVYEKDGVFRYKCHGCGINADVYDLRAMNSGTSVADAIKASGGNRPAPAQIVQARPPMRFDSLEAYRKAEPRIREVYTYADPDTGNAAMYVFRFGRVRRAQDV